MNPMVRSRWQDSAKSFVGYADAIAAERAVQQTLARLNGEETFRYAGGPVRPRVAKR
jgi:hypothetical protein